LTWDRWLSRDPRLSAAALVASQMPVEAAAEITALGEDPRCAAIVLMANGLGKPFGHPAYRPIIDAAADAGLPILLHVGGDTSLDVVTHGASAGRPATYTDHYALLSQSVTTHVVSLIGQGIFERHPDLKVFVVGAGVAWLTPVIWRFETNFKAMRRMTPGLTLSPMEYVMRNVRVSTYPLDRAADPSLMHRYLAAQEGMEELVVYASGYPTRDCDTRADVAAAFPSAWHRRIFIGNAEGVFRWPTQTAGDRVPALRGEQR
jgi:predicted TIM-barrel fold metal-dependent hydrolase